MSSSKVYLVTGASRGIGLALVDAIASTHENVAIVAAVRDVTSNNLKELGQKYPGKIYPVKYVAGDVQNNEKMVEEVKKKFGHVDVVIHNAAIATFLGTVRETSPEVLREHIEINTIGALVVFRATYELLKASVSSPKFIAVSTAAGSITVAPSQPLGHTPLGLSKAALNYLARKIHFENDWLICFPLHPGPVRTEGAQGFIELDNSGIIKSIMENVGLEPKESAAQVLKVIDESTREKDGGEFLSYDGSKLPW